MPLPKPPTKKGSMLDPAEFEARAAPKPARGTPHRRAAAGR